VSPVATVALQAVVVGLRLLLLGRSRRGGLRCTGLLVALRFEVRLLLGHMTTSFSERAINSIATNLLLM
jgi:hypothetical protein